MENYINGSHMPMGLGMALAENMAAMEFFASLSPQAQQSIIDHTHQIQSKQEMRAYVQSLIENRPSYF